MFEPPRIAYRKKVTSTKQTVDKSNARTGKDLAYLMRTHAHTHTPVALRELQLGTLHNAARRSVACAGEEYTHGEESARVISEQ